jgi:hypothetical protein
MARLAIVAEGAADNTRKNAFGVTISSVGVASRPARAKPTARECGLRGPLGGTAVRWRPPSRTRRRCPSRAALPGGGQHRAGQQPQADGRQQGRSDPPAPSPDPYFRVARPFLGLYQLLFPLHEEFSQLNSAHRDALNVALGFGEGTAPDRLVICNAALTVLQRSAAARPVLMIVNDLPWLDRVSAVVLGFAARRLSGIRVGFLAASRTGEGGFFESAGLAELELQPLDQAGASGLLSARFPALAADVRSGYWPRRGAIHWPCWSWPRGSAPISGK